MLGTYAVPDLIGVEHIGQRVEVVESLAEDDIDHGVNEVQPHQDVPKIGIDTLSEGSDPLRFLAHVRQCPFCLGPCCSDELPRCQRVNLKDLLQRLGATIDQSLNGDDPVLQQLACEVLETLTLQQALQR